MNYLGLPKAIFWVVTLCCGAASVALAKPLPNFNAQDATLTTNVQSKSLLDTRAALQSVHVAAENLHVDERLGLPSLITFKPNAALSSKSVGIANASPEKAARAHLQHLAALYQISDADIAGAKLHHVETFNDAQLVKFDNFAEGIEVFRESITVLLDANLDALAIRGQIGRTQELIALAKSAHAKAGITGLDPLFVVSPKVAIATALANFGFAASTANKLYEEHRAKGLADASRFFMLDELQTSADGSQMLEPARAKRVWFRLNDQLIPSYYVEVELTADDKGAPRYYSYVISAADGKLLFRNNLTAEMAYTYRVWAEPGGSNQPFPGPQGRNGSPHPTGLNDGYQGAFVGMNDITLQNGPISTNDPWLAPGATQTIGNNVEAWANVFAPAAVPPSTVLPADNFEAAPNECDLAASQAGDFHACTSSASAFQYSYNPLLGAKASKTQSVASVVNLFYINNWLHDWYYDSGFREIHGNAQNDNFGRGGIGNDSIRAQAQDNSGLNNASMSTPSDGGRPRMRMYVFSGDGASAVLAGSSFASVSANAIFGPKSFNLSATFLSADDATGNPNDGCQPLSNNVTGAIVLIERGSCGFKFKVRGAQNAGAIGVIVINNVGGGIGAMADDASITEAITIPSLIITRADGAALRTLLPQGLSARLFRTFAVDRDGTIDNLIVAHEWGHYISNRLIGNANGLTSNQSIGLGEGWADFHALLLQVKAEDLAFTSNANFTGVYASGPYANDGPQIPGLTFSSQYYNGIRRYPYSSELSKNPLTYKHIQSDIALPTAPPPAFNGNNAEVHNTGEVWASMLWGCYSNLLRDTPRLTFAQAQERMKRYLIAAYKLTPNDPMLLEARDALFAAIGASDANDLAACKAAFALRGAGVFARSGARGSLTNAGVVESFFADVPPNYPGNLQFTQSSQNGVEGAIVKVLVSRADGNVGAVSVNYATSDGTAKSGVDYIASTGTLNWAAGDTSDKSFFITIVLDQVSEAPKAFKVTLSDPVNGRLGAFTQVITVVDDGAFPLNCAIPNGWSKPANAGSGWSVATDSSFSGSCSLKSDTTADRASAQIQLTAEFAAGEVEFARRVSSEATFDCLRFLIDGVQQPYADNCLGATALSGESGEVAWGLASVPITAGMHTLTWSYDKDANTKQGEDAAWIDAVSLPLVSTSPSIDYSDMWWAGSSENGWGMSIQQHSNGAQFNALYVYDSAGLPRWYVMSGGTWSNNFSTYTGALYQPLGSPLNNFNTSQIVVGPAVGTVSINFTSSNTATISYTIEGIAGVKNITRQIFNSGTAPLNVGDMWWGGGAESGWGINIAQQQGALFSVWYTYGIDRKAQWYVMSGGGWNGTSYTAPLYATTGAPWLGTNYNPAALTITQVGTMSINFSNADTATLNYVFTAGPFAGTSQTKNIVRQPY